MNHELPDFQAGFRKSRGARDQIANICWIIEKVREFQKNIYFCFIDYAKAFVWITINYGKISRDRNTRPPDMPLKKPVCRSGRSGHGTTDWFQIGKGVRRGSILSPCLFNLYAEYIMRNAGLEEAQTGIKTANNLRYTDDTTLMAEVKSLLMKVKEESAKVGLSLSIQKTKIMASSPITSWKIDGKQWLSSFWGAPKSLQMVIAAMKLKDAYSLEGKL